MPELLRTWNNAVPHEREDADMSFSEQFRETGVGGARVLHSGWIAFFSQPGEHLGSKIVSRLSARAVK